MKTRTLRLFVLLTGLLLTGACTAVKADKRYTQRAPAQYLSTDPAAVEDTCPGNDIISRFTCTREQAAGFQCFDVYRVQGDPLDSERYTLLDQTLTEENSTAEPLCTFATLTCADFLKALNYNLDFSWFIDNFPSSSFPQCGLTYSCTRIACLKPLEPAPDGSPRSQKLACVFKKNQIFFLGTPLVCQDTNAPATAAQ
jgi:hypothetical protein